jgi:hypothetical protein
MSSSVQQQQQQQNVFSSLEAFEEKDLGYKKLRIHIVCIGKARQYEASMWNELFKNSHLAVKHCEYIVLDDTDKEKEKVKDMLQTEKPYLLADVVLFFCSYSMISQFAPTKKSKSKNVFMWPPNEEHTLQKHLRDLAFCRNVQEVWIYPSNRAQINLIELLFGDSKIRVVPQLWKAADASLEFDMQNASEEGGVDIAILSDHVSPTSTTLYPLLACELALQADPKCIRNILFFYSNKSHQWLAETQQLFEKCTHAHPKFQFIKQDSQDSRDSRDGLDALVPFFAKRKHVTVFLYHQQDATELPYFLWSLTHAHIPVVHNLYTEMSVGFKYKDNEMHTVIALLQLGKKAFCNEKDSTKYDEYGTKARESLQSLSPDSKTFQGLVRTIVKEWN